MYLDFVPQNRITIEVNVNSENVVVIPSERGTDHAETKWASFVSIRKFVNYGCHYWHRNVKEEWRFARFIS